MNKDPCSAVVVQAPLHADAEGILALASASSVFSGEEVAVLGELLREHFDRGADGSGYHFLIARNGHDLLGFACYGPRPLTRGTFDLYWLAVAPGHTGRGIGMALADQVAETIRSLGGRLLIAETSGLPGYLPARRFYTRHAFRAVATIPDFYAPGDDLVLFVRKVE